MSLLPGAVPGVRFGGTRRVSRRDRGRDSGRTPGDRHGAMRRRRREGGRPHTLSWRAAWAADAEWMSGKSRNRLALALTEASSWMSVLSAQVISACARRRIVPEHVTLPSRQSRIPAARPAAARPCRLYRQGLPLGLRGCAAPPGPCPVRRCRPGIRGLNQVASAAMHRTRIPRSPAGASGR